MYRRHLVQMLLNEPMSVSEIARQAGVLPAEVEQDLRHLVKSLRHGEHELLVIPAECRKCAFEFSQEKFRKPSKCPECRSTWINEPMIEVRARSTGTPGESRSN